MSVRLTYRDGFRNHPTLENAKDGVIQVSEIIEKSDYYPYGLRQKGNDLPDYSAINKYKYAYGGKELNDELGLDLYDFGARNYDPAVGRFFNIDNYAEKFSDVTPYQYAANNPVYFIDVNGDYIYIMDKGTRYKFDSGKLFAKDDEGNWAEHTPEAGSFLEQVYMELKSMYEFSTDGAGNSFGESFLNRFNNEKYNVTFHNSSEKHIAKRYKDSTQHVGDSSDGNSIIYLNIKEKMEICTSYNLFSPTDLAFIIIHELGHSLSFQYGIKQRSDTWIALPGNIKISKDEIFGMYIENQLRMEFKQPLRINYLLESDFNSLDNATINKGYMFQFDSGELTPETQKVLRNYKKITKNL